MFRVLTRDYVSGPVGTAPPLALESEKEQRCELGGHEGTSQNLRTESV